MLGCLSPAILTRIHTRVATSIELIINMLSHSRRTLAGTVISRRVTWVILILYAKLAVATVSPAPQIPISPPHIPQGASHGSGHGKQEFVMMENSCPSLCLY